MKEVKRIIAKITVGTRVVTIDDKIIDVYFENLDRSNTSETLNFGIYANRGSLSFVDKGNTVSNLILQNESIAFVKVEFYFKTPSTEKLLRTLYVQDIDVNEETNVVTLELISGIINWQTIKIPTIYEFREVDVTRLIAIINSRISGLGLGFTIATSSIPNIVIYCTYIESDTLWNIMTKVCELIGGRIYEDEYGNFYLTSDFKITSQTATLIEPKNILNISNYSPIYKNAINKDFSASFISRKKKTKAYIDDGQSAYIFDNNGNFANPSLNTMCNISEYDATKPLPNGVTLPSYDKLYARIETTVNCYEKLHKIYSEVSDIRIDTSVTLDFDSSVITGTATPEYFDFQYNLEKDALDYWIVLMVRSLSPMTLIETAKIRISADYFVDNETEEHKWGEWSEYAKETHNISSNELFQTLNQSPTSMDFSDWFLLNCIATNRRETLECECTLGQYIRNVYDADEGEYFTEEFEVFERDDVVEPYVIRKGERVKFNETYKVVGIKYSYKGILRQTLCLQSIN